MEKYRYTSEAIDRVIKEIGDILKYIEDSQNHDMMIYLPYLSHIVNNNDDKDYNDAWHIISIRVNKENYVEKITNLLNSDEITDKLTLYIEKYATDNGKEKLKKITEVYD